MIVLHCTSADPDWANVLVRETGSPDGTIECEFPTAIDYVALAWRVQDVDNYCALWTDNTYSTFTLGYVDAGVLTPVTSTGASDCTARVRVEVDGDDVRVYLNDELALDTDLLAGQFDTETRFGVACDQSAAATAEWRDISLNGEIQPLWTNVLPYNDHMIGPMMQAQMHAHPKEHEAAQSEWGGVVYQDVDAVVTPGP